MATNQPVSQLAVSIPVAPSTGAAPVRYSEPQSTSVPVSSVVMTGSTPVSTPTSGMHSPPLSGTLEEEANEKQAAHNAASQSQKPESGKRTTPSLTMTTPPPTLNAPAAFSNSNSKKSVISNNSCLEAEKRNSPSVTASQTQKSTPNVKITPAKDQPDMRSLMTHGGGDRTHDSALSVLPVGSRTAVNDRSRPDVYQARRLQNKQKTIEHVLQQGKILKLSRRLRTRLEYAILKIRRGWTKYTLQEVETLTQPVCSPRITPRQIYKSISQQSSPIQTEKRRIKHASHQRRLSDPARIEQFVEADIEMDRPPPQPQSSSPPERYRSRMPSLSIFKDSELFQPAKSLMEIATSKPEPGYLSPFLGAQSSFARSSPHNSPRSSHFGTPEPLYRDTSPVRDIPSQTHWSGYTSPTRDEPMGEEEQDESGAPSATQAARTILMLSSPTRPAPRTLNQNYIVEMHSGNPTHSPLGEWTAPYSPMTSSPLVQFQAMDSATSSHDQTPPMSHLSVPGRLGERERSPIAASTSPSNQRGSNYPSFRPSKQTYANLYEPSSPSPLSSALFPSSSSSDHLDRFKSNNSSSSSPTLKRAMRFAAAATQGSLEPPYSPSGLSAERIKDRVSGISGRNDYSPADLVHPGTQPGRNDKKEFSPTPSYAMPAYEDSYSSYQRKRDTTPPQQRSVLSPLSPRDSSFNNTNYNGQHGMRTPPPSGGKDMDVSQYSGWVGAPDSRTMRTRRNSGLASTGKTDDLTTLLRRGGSSRSNSSSPHPGTAAYRT